MGSEKSSLGAAPRALCILGAHRSGTSAVTRSFNLLGAFVGHPGDLMPASPTNPEGYWERKDINAIHERLLGAFRRSWDTVLVLPDGWDRAAEVAPHRAALMKTVSAVFAGQPLWVWKDPRTCILLELWKGILCELGTELSAVFVLRHPVDVAASLNKRNGFGPEKSWGIWFNHTLAALRSVEDVRTAFVDFSDFLEDPVADAQRCIESLGLARPDRADEAFAAVRKFVRRDLCHSRAGAEDLHVLPAPVRDLYQLALQAVRRPASCDREFSERVRELHRAYSGYAGFFREDMEQWQVVRSRIWGITRPVRALTDVIRSRNRPAAPRE